MTQIVYESDLNHYKLVKNLFYEVTILPKITNIISVGEVPYLFNESILSNPTFQTNTKYLLLLVKNFQENTGI